MRLSLLSFFVLAAALEPLSIEAATNKTPAAQVLQQKQNGSVATMNLVLDRIRLGVAEQLRYTLTVEADMGLSADFQGVGDDLGPFEVLEYNPFGPISLPNERRRWQREYVLLAKSAGRTIIPPLTVTFFEARTECMTASDCEMSAHGRRNRRNKPRTSKFELITDPIEIVISTVLPKDVDLTKPRDVLGPMALDTVADADGSAIGWGWGVAGLGAAALLGFGFFRPKRSAKAKEDLSEQPGRASTIALAALDKLRRQNLLHAGEHDCHHVQLSTILREYLANEFKIPAPEQTTTEVLASISDQSTLAAHVVTLRELLREIDLAKYAQIFPTAKHSRGMVDQAEQFVRASRAERPGHHDSI